LKIRKALDGRKEEEVSVLMNKNQQGEAEREDLIE